MNNIDEIENVNDLNISKHKLMQQNSFMELNPALLKILYKNSNPIINQTLEFLEKKTSIKRENVNF